MTDMAKRMLRDRIMERNRDDGYGDRRMRDRAMDRMEHGRHEYARFWTKREMKFSTR